MPNFKYMAQDSEGKKYRGTMEAAGQDELYMRLREQGQFLISSSEHERTQFRREIKSRDLADFCRSLGTLLRSGVSLVRALNIISQEENTKPWQRKIYANLLRMIRQGTPLSEAMEQQNGAFPPLLIHMFKSAEAGGNMDKVALRMAVHYDKDYKIESKIKSAMMYPSILMVLIVVVVVIIVTFVIPKFEELFSQMEQLPLPTRVVLGLSDLFRTRWYLVIGIVAAAIVLFTVLLRIDKVRRFKDKVKLRLPKFGKLLKVIYTARFARTLSSLYSSGLSIVTALQIGRKTIGNSYIDSQFDDVIAAIRGGGNLSDALQMVDGFSNKLISSIKVGEETGSLDSMLDSTADSMEYDSEMAINKMITLMEPILIIVMAVIVGFVMISVLLPIYQSYNAIGNSSY